MIEPGVAQKGAEWGGTGPFKSGTPWVKTFRGGGGPAVPGLTTFVDREEVVTE